MLFSESCLIVKKHNLYVGGIKFEKERLANVSLTRNKNYTISSGSEACVITSGFSSVFDTIDIA